MVPFPIVTYPQGSLGGPLWDFRHVNQTFHKTRAPPRNSLGAANGVVDNARKSFCCMWLQQHCTVQQTLVLIDQVNYELYYTTTTSPMHRKQKMQFGKTRRLTLVLLRSVTCPSNRNEKEQMVKKFSKHHVAKYCKILRRESIWYKLIDKAISECYLKNYVMLGHSYLLIPEPRVLSKLNSFSKQ